MVSTLCRVKLQLSYIEDTHYVRMKQRTLVQRDRLGWLKHDQASIGSRCLTVDVPDAPCKDYAESLTLWRRIFLIGCIQHDMIALCEPVIILYGLIPVTLVAWSLSFSPAASIILVEWMIVLLMEQQVVIHHSVLCKLNRWLFC